MRSRMAFVDRREQVSLGACSWVPGGRGVSGLLLWLYAAAVINPRVGAVSW
jgi:hypothetical protein